MKAPDLFLKLRLNFVKVCITAVGILLVILFSILWFINYRNNLSEVHSALSTVLSLHRYGIVLPGANSEGKGDGIPELDEDRSLYSRTILFSVNQEGIIDYQTLYIEYPYLMEYDDAHEIIETTIETYKEGRTYFKLNDRFYRIASSKHDDHVDYAFFDWTTERSLIYTSATWFVIAFFFAIVTVGLLAYVHSDSVLDPVKKGLDKGKALISNASHELKTPLTIMSANLSVIRSEPHSTVEENEKWLSIIDEQIKRTNTLVLDMLELSKLEDKKLELRDEVDLSSLVMSNMLSVDALCFEKEIVINDVVEENVRILGNKPSLERLILILLDNAIKYTPNRGSVEVNLHKTKRSVILSVKNSGEGIKEEDLPYVFERFYKGDRARTQESNAKSFGLGLAIAKSIAEHHNGKIECSSQKGITEFKVTFKSKIRE